MNTEQRGFPLRLVSHDKVPNQAPKQERGPKFIDIAMEAARLHQAGDEATFAEIFKLSKERMTPADFAKMVFDMHAQVLSYYDKVQYKGSTMPAPDMVPIFLSNAEPVKILQFATKLNELIPKQVAEPEETSEPEEMLGLMTGK